MFERILVVGLGSIGERHLRLAREMFQQADIRVLRHAPCQAVPEFSNGCFSEIEHALGFAPQIAVVANPAPYHVAVAERLAQAGVHLLIEKPLAVGSKEVGNLLDSVRQHGTTLLTGYNLRFLPSLRKFRDLIRANAVGKVISVRCEIGQFLPSWRPGRDYRQGVSARKDLGGGVLFELSHEIDYLRWIFGEIEQVQARLSKQSGLEIDVEDTAHLIFGFKPDANGNRLVGTLNMDFIRHDTTRICTAIGDRGSLRWNGISGIVEKFEPGAKEWQEVFKHQAVRDETYRNEWLHFAECIEGHTTPLISGLDGLRVLEVIEAARQAAETGCQAIVVGEYKNE